MTEAIENPTEKPVHVSLVTRQQLEIKCQNRLNWSDGGHWIGSGSKPNCFMSNNLKNSISHTYKFPSDNSAMKWNLEWEKIIRYSGHLGTAALTVAVSAATVGIAGVAVGTLAAILKDELQASIPYPRMARDWSYEVIFEYHFKWSPHPWAQRELKQIITTISRDFDGKIVNRTASINKYKLADLPDGLGRLLASSPSNKTSSIYG